MLGGIMNHIESEGDLIYYNEEFRVVLENHLHYLIKHPDTTISIVQDHEMIKNKCDIYSLFLERKIPKQYHWVMLRLLGLNSPFLNRIELSYIIIPPFNEIENIKTAYISRKYK